MRLRKRTKTSYIRYRATKPVHLSWLRRIKHQSLTLVYVSSLLIAPVSIILKAQPSQAAAPYQASDVLGQTDINGTPSFTKNYPNNGQAGTQSTGLHNPYDMAIDTVAHQLYVTDTSNNRILVYDLNNSNQPIDRVADHVLGQSDFTSTNANTTASGFNAPRGISLDTTNHRLYVTDAGNARVLVFDTTTITDNEDAINVLGQPNFTTASADTNAKGFYVPNGVSVDPVHNRLYVADTYNHRVLVFDTTTITDNEDAINVLGQPNFTTAINDTNAKGFYYPQSLTIDSTNNRLYVADTYNHRVLVFDTTTITDNEDAINVLGQPDFTTNTYDINAKGFSSPLYLAVDTVNNRLYVTDSPNRVLIFDTTTITDNEDAINVLGQPNFTTNTNDTNAKGFSAPQGIAVDPADHLVYVADNNNNRILIFDTTTITDNEDAINVLGQSDPDGTPSFTRGGYNNISNPGPTNNGFYGQGYGGGDSALDTVHHRLFVADGGNYRILVYSLDSNNNLIDHEADYVLGCADFSDTGCSASNFNYMYSIGSLAYDAVNDRLFVPDLYNSYRVLVFDFSSGIHNGMDASYVIGQDDFISSAQGTSINRFNYSDYGSVAYDTSSGYLYVTDAYSNNRIMVFDVSPGNIHNGMDASYVLGASDFNTVGGGGCVQNQLSYAYSGGLAVDPNTHRLFVANYGCGNILIFDTSNLNNGMNASYELGCTDFSCGTYAGSHGIVSGVEAFAYDPVQQLLFANDYVCAATMIFDLSGTIHNGMDAVATLGQSSFGACGGYGQAPTQSNFYFDYGGDGAFDSANRRLYVADDYNQRVMIFNFIKLADTIPTSITKGASFSQTLASNYQGTLGWHVDSGSLPPGLSLTSDGKLTGTPTQAGNYSFSLTATDDNGAIGSFKDSKSYSMQVLAASTGSGTSASSPKKSSSSSSSSGSGSSAVGTDIVLNSFSEYFSETGKTITGLKPGDTLHFCVSEITACDPASSNYHSITVKNIDLANNTVTLTFHSDPIDVTFTLNQAKTVDVDKDGADDIQATLTGLTATTANFTFKRVANVTTQTNTTSQPSITTAAPEPPAKKSNLLWLLLGGVVVLVLIAVLVAKKRKQRPGPPAGPIIAPQL